MRYDIKFFTSRVIISKFESKYIVKLLRYQSCIMKLCALITSDDTYVLNYAGFKRLR